MISINSKYPEMIFRNDVSGYTFYSVGLTNKAEDGTYNNGSMRCKFKKGVELENKTKIYIKNGFVSFYKKDKVTIPYLFITEFETVTDTIERIKEEAKENAFNENEIELTDDDLPF